MPKYIYENIDHFLKNDSKLIKIINPNLKKNDILDTLSNILGWESYEELQSNIKNKNHSKVNYISELEYKELEKFKQYYFDEIYKKFPLKREHDFDDPYQIEQGRIFKIVNKKSIIFGKENNNCLTIDLSDNKTFIKFKNYQTELFTEMLLEEVQKRFSSGDAIWNGRQVTYFQSFIKAIKNDVRNLDFQTEIINMFSFNYLFDYIKDYLSFEGNKERNLYGLVKYICNFLIFNNNNDKVTFQSLEMHGYITMPFFQLQDNFFNRHWKNKKTYNFDDLINHNGAIEFIYTDDKYNSDLVDINVLYGLISKLRTSKIKP